MTIDVVCGMEIDETETLYSAAYGRSEYRFCSEGCRAEFLRHPEDYADNASPEGGEIDGRV